MKQPTTKVGELMAFVNQLEVILHPNVTKGFKELVWAARSEMAQEAKDQVFSRELQELQPVLEDFRRSIKIYGNGGASPRMLWHMRPLLKKIIELYGTKK